MEGYWLPMARSGADIYIVLCSSHGAWEPHPLPQKCIWMLIVERLENLKTYDSHSRLSGKNSAATQAGLKVAGEKWGLGVGGWGERVASV